MRLPRIQFSLLGLLAAMAVFGVALACIIKFGLSLPMVTILWSLLLLTLVVMPVLAFVGKPERRAFHSGFAWFGWMYIAIYVFGFMTDFLTTSQSISPINFPQLTIERGIFVVYKWVLPLQSQMVGGNDPETRYESVASQYDSGLWTPNHGSVGPLPMPVTGGGGGVASSPLPASSSFGGVATDTFAATVPSIPLPPYRYVPWEIFRDVAHALLAALWATMGGILTMYLARRNTRRQSESATPTPR